jgi:hypothetical protein
VVPSVATAMFGAWLDRALAVGMLIWGLCRWLESRRIYLKL